MIYVRIISISRPDSWYSRFRRKIFAVEISLFGYRVAEGEEKGKMISARDAAAYTYPKRHRGTYKPQRRKKRANRHRAAKEPLKALEKVETTMQMDTPILRSSEPLLSIDQQIAAYAKWKRGKNKEAKRNA